MRHNESFEELAALRALDALEGEDARSFDAHLAEGCVACEEILADLRAAGSALASAAPSVAPRPEVRRALLAAVRDDSTGTPVVSLRPRRRASEAIAWALAAAASLALVFLGLDIARLRRERAELGEVAAQANAKLASTERELARRDLRVKVLESEDVRILFLSGQGPQPEARAKVFWSEKAKRGVLLAGSLAKLPADKQYELWVFDRGKPVPAGVFDADEQGRALLESPDLSTIAAAQNFAVTVEPRGGVPAPTGPIVLVGTPAA
jgi:anti-sigma-K factor RskA